MTRPVLPLAFLVAAPLLAGCWSAEPIAADGRDRDVNTVQAEDLEGRDLQRVEQMLRGQIAGVSVRQGPTGLIIRVRGSRESSFLGTTSNDPLFVVDGLPIELGADGALDGINPRDVDTIRVLKNASETAMYGSRGANGVILITTVRPPARPQPTEEDG